MVTEPQTYRQKAAQQTPRNELMKFSEYKDQRGGDWEEFKTYLAEHGQLSPELTARIY